MRIADTLLVCALGALGALTTSGCKAKKNDNPAPSPTGSTATSNAAGSAAKPSEAAPNPANSGTLDLAKKADREALLRQYAQGVVATADQAMAGKKGSDDACQTDSVCQWSRSIPLPKLLGGPDARLFRNARFAVSYSKQDPKRFTVRAALPSNEDWHPLYTCALLSDAVEVPRKDQPGITGINCKLTAGPAKGAIVDFSQLGSGPALVILTSPARS